MLCQQPETGRVYIYDFIKNLLLMITNCSHPPLEGHGEEVHSVCLSPNGKQLASGSEDRTVRLWDMATGASVKTLEGHGRWVMSVCFSPDGKRRNRTEGCGLVVLIDSDTPTLLALNR